MFPDNFFRDALIIFGVIVGLITATLTSLLWWAAS